MEEKENVPGDSSSSNNVAVHVGMLPAPMAALVTNVRMMVRSPSLVELSMGVSVTFWLVVPAAKTSEVDEIV